MELLPSNKFDLIVTHSTSGEYTKHLRHEETAKAVLDLCDNKELLTSRLWAFAYEDNDRQYLPRAIEQADILVDLEEQIVSIDSEETLPVIFLNGITSQATPVPTLYAIRYFCRELESAIDLLLDSPELQNLLSLQEEEKNRIHEHLQKIMHRFQEFLMADVRR